MAVHFESVNQEYGIGRRVIDDPRNPKKFAVKVYCAVTGSNLGGVENITDVDEAKSRSLAVARRYYT